MRRLPLLVVLLGLACATRSSDSAVVVPEAEVAAIEWRQWSPAAFDDAKAQDKMILVDVGMEGCTACRWMDELTYTDPAVIARVREHFVPIVVDSEARPDLGDRYEPWGWPATIVMDPAGTQVLAIRGNKLPKNFVPILDELIAAKAAGTLTADGLTPIAVEEPASGPLIELRDTVARQLDARWNDEAGDWGGKLRSPKNRAMQYAMLRAHARGQAQWNDRAMRTLEGWRSLIDPVWGGIFVASFRGLERADSGEAAAPSGGGAAVLRQCVSADGGRTVGRRGARRGPLRRGVPAARRRLVLHEPGRRRARPAAGP